MLKLYINAAGKPLAEALNTLIQCTCIFPSQWDSYAAFFCKTWVVLRTAYSFLFGGSFLVSPGMIIIVIMKIVKHNMSYHILVQKQSLDCNHNLSTYSVKLTISCFRLVTEKQFGTRLQKPSLETPGGKTIFNYGAHTLHGSSSKQYQNMQCVYKMQNQQQVNQLLRRLSGQTVEVSISGAGYVLPTQLGPDSLWELSCASWVGRDISSSMPS